MAAGHHVDSVLKREILYVVLWLVVTAAGLYLLEPVVRRAWYRLQDIPIIAPMEMKHPVKSVVQWDESKADNGYTVVVWQYRSTVILVDMSGSEVHRWTLPVSEILKGDTTRKGHRSNLQPHDVLVYPNGDLLIQMMLSGVTPYGYALARLDKDSRLLWKYRGNAHHTIYRSPTTGHIDLLTHTFIDSPPALKLEEPRLLADQVVTLSDSGEVLDTLSVIDAFIGTPFQPLLETSSSQAWDIFHTNSIDRLQPHMQPRFPQFKKDSLLLSIRNRNLLAVIDPESRKVVWARTGRWQAQHSAHFLESGNILLFDNLGKRGDKDSPARILEVDLDGNIVWEYPKSGQPEFFSYAYGRVQPLGNGNRLITQSVQGRICEVTPDGDIVWDYTTRKKNMFIMSAVRYRESELPFLKERAD
jgi:hypothetical protein